LNVLDEQRQTGLLLGTEKYDKLEDASASNEQEK